MTSRPVRLAALAASTFAAATLAAPDAPARPAGTVSFVHGEAACVPARPGASAPRPLSVGTLVHVGDGLETGRHARLEVKLADGSVLRLGPGSRLTVASASFGRAPAERDVSLRLRLGNAWATVAKAVGGGRFEVTTEHAVAGVRGTTFRVDAAQDRSVVVKVYGGTVAVVAGAVPRPAHAAPGAERERGPGPGSVAGAHEVTREPWERQVTRMMEVRVAADGTPREPRPFVLADADEFERWNRERDAALDGEGADGGEGPAR